MGGLRATNCIQKIYPGPVEDETVLSDSLATQRMVATVTQFLFLFGELEYKGNDIGNLFRAHFLTDHHNCNLQR